MRPTAQNKDSQHLGDIYDLIWEDTERAWNEAQAAMRRYKSKKLTYAYARAQMLVYFIAQNIRSKVPGEIDTRALLTYFEANNHAEEASLLTLWMIGERRNRGLHEATISLERDYARKYSKDEPTRHQITRMISEGNHYMMRNMDKTAQLELALKAEALLRAMPVRDAWYRASLSSVLQLKAEALSHTNEMPKARAAIDESIALTEEPGTSLQYLYTAYYFKGNVAAISGSTDEALECYYLLEKKFAGQRFYDFLLIFVYLQIFKQLNVKFSDKAISAKDKEQLLTAQLKYIFLAQSLPVAGSRPYLVAYLSLSEARLMRVTGEYPRAISRLARALRIFVKNNITNHIIDIYEEAYQIYEAWAEKEHNHILYQKAIKTLKRAHDLTYRYNQTEGKEKMDAIINQYELRQRELNEKLLHEKMTAMNKEIQLTALSLHEKILVLDELKVYVNSLRKKGQETNQLIRAIAQKIDTVIITEQDKSTLQQKLDEGNADFFSMLSEMCPRLSSLEVRMCSLLKTGMTNKELSKLYGQGEKSYEQHRYRIKKKLGLGAEVNLVKFLTGLTQPAAPANQ